MHPDNDPKFMSAIEDEDEEKITLSDDEVLEELTAIYKRYKEIYDGTGLCGFSDTGIHVHRLADMLDIFGTVQVSKNPGSKYQMTASATHVSGAKFFAIFSEAE